MEFYSEEQAKYHAEHKTIANKGIFTVYGYFGLGILVTAIVALGLPYLVTALFGDGADSSSIYFSIVFGCSIGLIVFSLISNFTAIFQHPIGMIVCYTLYAVCFGGLMSMIALIVGYSTLTYALGITSAMFLFMSLIGYMSKGRLNKWIYYTISIVFALLIAALFNILIFNNSFLYWVVSYAIILVFMLLIIVDTSRIMQAGSENVLENNKTYAVYCAYRLYSDFMILLYYILRIIVIVGAKGGRR
ncbi:MAG: Bax inhibitor-1 family protein [Bacilli bacterium]|nr:Bax inhibitor-1 family protein [Bacilli bacterium]